ncbi:MAG: APC family permease [Oscillibacter sp.]
MEKNQFRLADVILSVICVVFVAEAAAPVASIGNSQYFWWIFMILAFLLPYGLIAAELGTAYAGDGGLYDWIHAAYPNGKWAARASWYYWINFPLWMASLAVMCPELITFITGRSLGTFGSLVVELLFIWIVTLIACYPVCDSIIILNVSAVIKIVLALLVGGLGVWYISRYGFVNDMSARTFLPSFDLNSLSYISVIIFNFLGFEVVCTYANNMSDPKKQIPQSIVTGGIVIAAIYLFSAFGIGAAVDVREISVDSGLIDAVSLILGGSGGVLVGVVALLFLVTLFGNMISWSMGVNSTAALAADHNDMPAGVRQALGKERHARRRGGHVGRRRLVRVCFGRAHRDGVAGLVTLLELFRAESRDAAFELSSRVSGVFEAAARGCEDAAPVPRAGV